jgi:hypothetical protein
MKLHSYFRNFLDHTVNLDDARIEKLNQRVDAISSFLRAHEVFGELFIDVIAQGSFAHRTIIKPVGNREYDADVLLSMKQHPDWTPAQYTQELYKAFDGGRYKGMAHRRTRCVFIDYSDPFHVDVVPYVESRHDYAGSSWKRPSTAPWIYSATPVTTTRLRRTRSVGSSTSPSSNASGSPTTRWPTRI